MPRKGRLHWIALAGASALATVGLVWLGLRISKVSDQWSAVALASPLAIKCILLIVGGVVALVLVAALLIRLKPAAAARKVRDDQGGTAAVEMVLLMPFALMIFLTVIQAALLFNANMVVHYAAYCAARVATVVVPMTFGEEQGVIGGRPLVWPCTEDDQGPSMKIELMRRAAVLALVPISASMPAGQGSVNTLGAALDQATRGAFAKAGVDNPWWLHRIQEQYNYADAYTRVRLAPPDHWQDGDPDNDCPYSAARRTTWGTYGWNYAPYCPYYHRVPGPPIWDFWYWEDLDVRIRYSFLLEVPYISLFLGDPVTIPGRQGRSFATEIRWVGTLSNEGGPEIRPRDATQ